MGAKRLSAATHPLYRLAQKKWKSSGIKDAHAETLGFEPLTGEEVQAALGVERAQAGGLRLPYFDLNGKQTDFFRIRYLEPLPGFAGAVEKPQRYAQRAGTLNEVYLPPTLVLPWAGIAEDVKVPIYITEGELKSAAGCAIGLATIGLGGVDVWRSTKRGIGFLPALEEIKWKGRAVSIIYDSDASTNANVVRAQQQLAKELVSRGALPSIVVLPSGKDGSKQGLDDFLLANGEKELLELIERSPAFAEAQALWDMNDAVLYIRDPGFVVNRDTGQRLDPSSFVTHAYANRFYIAEESNKSGITSLKKKPLAPAWLAWEHRSEVAKITYRPGQPRILADGYNSWKGWGVEPKKGDIGPWVRLLDHVFSDFVSEREWFEFWAAFPFQNPGAKLYTAIVMWGTHKGTGKTAIGYALAKIYGENAIEIKSKDLKGGFNQWAANRQFVIGDEITGGQARVDADWLKGTITQSHVRINEKYKAEYTIPDCINYFFTSNHPDAIFLEDNDRRYFVHEVKGKPLPQSFYDEYDKWLHGEGPSALLYHFLHMDLSRFHPRAHAPDTQAKRAMLLHGKSDLGLWCVTLKEEPTTALRSLGQDIARSCHLFTPTQLHKAYINQEMSGDTHRSKVSVSGVGRALADAGFRQVNGGTPIRTKAGIVRLWSIRDQEHWEKASPKEMALHYEKHFIGNEKK